MLKPVTNRLYLGYDNPGAVHQDPAAAGPRRRGNTLAPLLRQARTAAPQLVERLLAALAPAVARTTLPNADALSEQELRVLRLMVAGHSNQEIAVALVISVGTAKWHVHNILQKLGVGNRPKAIARARELGLV